MAVAKDGFSARYNMTHKEVSETFHCSNPFGLESGKITDDQITASSSFYDEHWLPRQARLNYNDNAWTPNEDSNREYIQVDLHVLKVLTGIATQGAISKETLKSYYVTAFKLEVSTNGEDWMIYRHGKNHKLFHANTDPPQTWKNGIALRFELYGCQITDAPCSELQGMMSGLLPDSQISSSSMRDLHGSMGAARLVASRSGWFPNPTQPIAGEEWLRYTLFNFRGNSHYDTPEVRRFDEIVAQFVRVFPERWSPAGIGMRMEVLGCDLPATTPSLSAVCDFESSLCGWSADPQSGVSWSLHTASSGTSTGHSTHGSRLDLTQASDSPGSLRVLLRDTDQDEMLLWSLRGDQGALWREGRTVLPQSPKEYQVVFEGFFEHPTRGHIRIDNIHMSSSVDLDQCTQPLPALTPGITNPRPMDFGKDPVFNRPTIGEEYVFHGWPSSFSTPSSADADPSSVTLVSEKDKDNAWLYTLDPILLTIIVMSSLGVLLGAICAGLLLYCTCSYSGLSSRSSTTLENYNFELYDGIKHKVKINQQRCCSEA
ncbi:hypothetical protein WMY93_002146 [Mugilogobius chulae]|uniref:Neuropilin-2-like n=1 Tax=Mugilogobius chulae TaxID=88201 RepID=A0AAW0PV11_9GOBI